MRLEAVILPELGTGPHEPIVISHWYAEPGDLIWEGDHLVEILVGPATFEISVPASGTLAEIRIDEDEQTHAGAVLGLVAVLEGDDEPSGPSVTLS